jgi:hypothetical protein
VTDPRITHPCPFCGEREYLRVHPGSVSRPIIEGDDTLKDVDGEELAEVVDAIGCDVCEALAPADVWNRQRPPEVYAVLRDFEAETGP